MVRAGFNFGICFDFAYFASFNDGGGCAVVDAYAVSDDYAHVLRGLGVLGVFEIGVVWS